MNLTEAVDAVAPVVGDGKLIAQHAYVLCTRNILMATDGRHWVKVDINTGTPSVQYPEFCVRHNALKRALEREHIGMREDGANGLIVSYRRGRAHLKGVNPDTWPTPPETELVGRIHTLEDNFHKTIKDLLPFCSTSDGHVWQQAVHVLPDFMFAANSYALVKFTGAHWDLKVGIPSWVCRFIASRDKAPRALEDRGSMIRLGWEGIDLYSTLLTEEPPASIIEFATGLTAPTKPVPEGLREAVLQLVVHDAKTCKIGLNAITYITEQLELLEGITGLEHSVKTWGVDTLCMALEHADYLDLDIDSHGHWSGGDYIGVFAGRSD